MCRCRLELPTRPIGLEMPDNRLINEDTEPNEVKDCASPFHSGVVLAEK